MNWIKFLTRSKGIWDLFKRGQSIFNRYGLSTSRMSKALDQLNQVLESHQCSGTFPITASALSRHPEVIHPLAQRGMEFAIHGYVHVDHSQLSSDVQHKHVGQALNVFIENGIACQGFRSPYLHWNSGTVNAIKNHELLYVSNQPILWDVIDNKSIEQNASEAYDRVIDFYSVKPASQHLSVPRLDGIISIPVSLPDDEMLIERLRFNDTEKIRNVWCSILQQTYERGELFTLSLHPERTMECYQALADVLSYARSQCPAIWIAQLRDIADWWRRKQVTNVTTSNLKPEQFHLQIQGPKELTILVRGVEVNVPTQPWFGKYHQVAATQFDVYSSIRPFIGVTLNTSASLIAFLRELGYLVEVNEDDTNYGLYLDNTEFTELDKKRLVDRIEESDSPLIRLGLWPDGKRSVLSITGDIDALTLWDFGLRLLGA